MGDVEEYRGTIGKGFPGHIIARLNEDIRRYSI